MGEVDPENRRLHGGEGDSNRRFRFTFISLELAGD